MVFLLNLIEVAPIPSFRAFELHLFFRLHQPMDATWDVDLVKSIFWPVDVNWILQIPLTLGREDCVAWHYNRNGMFSVKSAYHCQWESKYGPRIHTLQATGASRSQAWKRLWKLDLPGKIKIFGWRALHGFIPCMAVLANRHISNIGGCPVCKNGVEDIKHVIFTCDRAKAVWSSLRVWEKILEVIRTDRSGSVIVEEVLRRGRL